MDPNGRFFAMNPSTVLSTLLEQSGRIDELRELAAAGDWFAANRVEWYDRKADLRNRAQAGDESAAIELAFLLKDDMPADAAAMLTSAADAGNVDATRFLADLLTDLGDVDQLRSRAERGDSAAAAALANLQRQQEDRQREEEGRRLASQLAAEGCVDKLRAHVDAHPNDLVSATYLDDLLYHNADVEGLRALGDAETYGTSNLINLLVRQGRIEEVIDEVHAGNKWAKTAWANWLRATGQHPLADRLDRYGILPDGTIAES